MLASLWPRALPVQLLRANESRTRISSLSACTTKLPFLFFSFTLLLLSHTILRIHSLRHQVLLLHYCLSTLLAHLSVDPGSSAPALSLTCPPIASSSSRLLVWGLCLCFQTSKSTPIAPTQTPLTVHNNNRQPLRAGVPKAKIVRQRWREECISSSSILSRAHLLTRSESISLVSGIFHLSVLGSIGSTIKLTHLALPI